MVTLASLRPLASLVSLALLGRVPLVVPLALLVLLASLGPLALLVLYGRLLLVTGVWRLSLRDILFRVDGLGGIWYDTGVKFKATAIGTSVSWSSLLSSLPST
uniref:Uncharacterized protein n=1 Tax=Cannabis sativa TaxID=3483 RepID=A0A803Q6X2_CANSA